DRGRRCWPDASDARSVDLVSEMRRRYFAESGVRLRAGAQAALRFADLRFFDADDRWRDAFFPHRKGVREPHATARGSAVAFGFRKRRRETRAGTANRTRRQGIYRQAIRDQPPFGKG